MEEILTLLKPNEKQLLDQGLINSWEPKLKDLWILWHKILPKDMRRLILIFYLTHYYKYCECGAIKSTNFQFNQDRYYRKECIKCGKIYEIDRESEFKNIWAIVDATISFENYICNVEEYNYVKLQLEDILYRGSKFSSSIKKKIISNPYNYSLNMQCIYIWFMWNAYKAIILNIPKPNIRRFLKESDTFLMYNYLDMYLNKNKSTIEINGGKNCGNRLFKIEIMEPKEIFNIFK